MRRFVFICLLFAVTLLGGVTARGEVFPDGKLLLGFDARLAPHALPRDRAVPVTVRLHGTVKTLDGSRPPQLRRMSIAVNRYGLISTRGLPICRPEDLEGTSYEAALARCRGALVGRGRFGANVDFPDLKFPVEGQMLAFNSRSRGRPAIALHIYGTNPVEATFVLMFRISHRPRGQFGTVLSTRIPRIAADLGYLTDLTLTFGRRYRHEGEARSFLSARCAAPPGFPGALFALVQANFVFANGQTLSPTLARDCRVR
jgi:hypothetical protein